MAESDSTRPQPHADLAAAQAALNELRKDCRSILLATTNVDGSPEASYAPFVVGEAGSFCVLVSGLARHTENMLRTGRAAVMLVEDESAATQIFARRRATFGCGANLIEREGALWMPTVDALEARRGGVVSMLRGLADFRLLRLVPENGRLVLGFGQAYRIGGVGWDEPEPLPSP